jgi:hypothetical protein
MPVLEIDPATRGVSRRTRVLTAAVAALVLPVVAQAEDVPDFLNDSFHLALGSYIVNTDTTLSVDGDVSTGTPIDWEDTFGGGDLTRFRIDGQWRFADRHKARFMVFNTSRSKSRTLTEEIEFDGTVYPVNAKVDADFSFDIYELAYEYSILKHESYEVAGSLGVHYTTLSAGLKAKAASSNGTLSTDLDSDASVDLPLPVIGLRGTWGLPHNLWIDAGAQFFALSIDEYDGNLQDYRVALTWQPRKWLGLGIGYNVFRVDVDVDKQNFGGSLDWQYDGPMLSYSTETWDGQLLSAWAWRLRRSCQSTRPPSRPPRPRMACNCNRRSPRVASYTSSRAQPLTSTSVSRSSTAWSTSRRTGRRTTTAARSGSTAR